MKFSGHETFSPRDGWLSKGLKLLVEEPTKYQDPYLADWLGVGKNMAKSIKHWLLVTGLADSVNKSLPPSVTSVGQLIYQQDPYFNQIGTLWALHVNLVNNTSQATSWYWFFNHFFMSRFEKPVCVENLNRYLQNTGTARIPSLKTLEKDLGCMLRFYAQELPVRPEDPEESYESPFLELGLLTHHRTSGSYQVNKSRKNIHPYLLGYAISTMSKTDSNRGTQDFTLREVSSQNGSPGKAFLLSAETLYELFLEASRGKYSNDFDIRGLAGERILRVARKEPLEWLSDYYEETLPQQNSEEV